MICVFGLVVDLGNIDFPVRRKTFGGKAGATSSCWRAMSPFHWGYLPRPMCCINLSFRSPGGNGALDELSKGPLTFVFFGKITFLEV